MKKYILCESRLDFKYKMIFSKLDKDLVIVEGGLKKLIKNLIRKKSFYHIRYIKNRGFFLTLFRLVLIYICTKISNSKIIYTCHNIYEHNFKSRLYNDFIRNFVVLISNHIFVFHKDLINYLPSFSKNKISVGTFGNYKKFIEGQTLPNKDFQKNYSAWLNKKNIKSPDLISISAAKKNRLFFFIENINKKLNFLIISPFVYFDTTNNLDNVFIYNKSFVKHEINSILNDPHQKIGILGHDNLSVPTSIYMFASYNIPVIVLNVRPLNSLIEEYRFGEIVKHPNELSLCISKIQKNYKSYQSRCKKFINKNTWDNSIKIHKSVFK